MNQPKLEFLQGMGGGYGYFQEQCIRFNHFFVTLKTTHGKKKISLVAFDTSRV